MVADERARLFVALELPEAVRDALAGWQSRVLAEREGLRPVAPESLHVTLCFLGWQPASQAGLIATVTRGAVAGFRAPRLSIGEAVWLPRRRPRVLAIELRDAQGALSELQAALSDQLSAGGWYQAEQRRFLPHVTAARVGRSAQRASGAVPAGALGDPAGARAVPADALGDLPNADFNGSRVTLYRSRLLAGGARYEALASVALGNSGPTPVV